LSIFAKETGVSHLVLHLFGQPRLEQDGRPEEIKFRKSWALLAYLGAGETDATRDTLATLLWPESDQDHARASLRRALFELNQTPLGTWLVADRFTISLRPEARHHIDVVEFARLVARGDIGALQQAVALYQGDFLSSFYLSDSQPFEEWSTMQREGYRRQVLEALDTLTSHYLAQANYALAESAARRQLAIDDLRESAWRGLMEALVRDGRRNQALTEYRRCRQLLRDELGVVPATETTDLYEQIRLGELAIATPVVVPQSAIPVHRPAFLDDEAKPVQAPRAIFVARERELQQLDEFLRAALGGENRVVFVTGGPGRGKTALLGEFARQSIKAHPDLLVAAGHCNAYSGVGDPYLPFREVLGMLSGDVETLWAAGSVSREHARRLWQAVPLASRALLDHGPFLIDTLVPGSALLARATAFAPADGGDRLDALRAWVERETGSHIGLDQSALFAQVTNVLAAMSAAHPLLLLLDDLQWADKGSVGLLFHLGRRLENAPILIVGAYRPEEITLIQDGELHRLQELVTEFKRLFGDTALDLTQADAVAGRQFVDRLLDTEPNRLSADFRTTLHQHTGGHPLFTAELLRAMQERGDLVRDKAGLWTESQELDWRTLPARVGAVIEKRLQRLDPDLRSLLAVASVEGEHFTAQVVASVEEIPERQVLRALSMELGPAGHRLVWEAEEIQSGSRFLSRFRFAHALFQEYLYNGLVGGERRLLHGEVAAALEKVYQAQSYEIAARLAHHYTQAGQREKAIEYSLLAGDQARRAFANEEAVAHYERVLAWIAPSVPPAVGEDRSPFISLPSNGKDATAERAWWLEALTGLGKVQYFVGQLEDAETCFRDALALAEHTKLVPSQVVQLRWWLGEVLFWRGRLDEVVRNAEAGLALLSQEDESAEAALMVSHLVAVFMQQQELQKSRIFAERLASFLQQLPYIQKCSSRPISLLHSFSWCKT